ncbi:MAG: N-succinylarginine dihydrolase, partial [Deltaproteobacteria bacterium]|nr:N-succinylarginine dihydrolase [Deltaproteobacteria bacterium]
GLTESNPRAAALEGLGKMKLLMDLGIPQAVLPPHERPDLWTLRDLGFCGTDYQIIAKAAREAPFLLAACYSASGMWTANSATVSPSPDTADGLVHFTPANLVSFFHRSIEQRFTAKVLEAIFNDQSAFVHHKALPGAAQFSDEGAANHTRLCKSYGEPGIELFVYGRKAFDRDDPGPSVFPARQSFEASAAIARLHRLDLSKTLFFRQNPEAIDAGVFHNDVISVGNQHVFVFHSGAFVDGDRVIGELRRTFEERCQAQLFVLEVTQDQLPASDAVKTYLFNSQLVTLPDQTMCLIAPLESKEHEKAGAMLAQLLAESNPISKVRFIDIRQSMKNGGGPACLRLRVVLTDTQLSLVHEGVLLTEQRYRQLEAWIHCHYRDRLNPQDLADPLLAEESRSALDALTQILQLGSVYDFQQNPRM